MKAFCFGDCKSGGKFQKYLKGSKDENGFKISNFAMQFNFSNKTMVCEDSKGKKIKIDLSERCSNADGAPYRYYFWLKSNKLKSPSSVYWRTESFVGTTERINEGKGVDYSGKPIESNTYNANQKGVDGYAIPRLFAVAKSGTFFRNAGSSLSKNGAKYGNSIYVIDLKAWYLQASKDGPGYTGNIYLQSVTGIHHPNGAWKGGPYTTLLSWWNAATANGFASVGKRSYYQHYNQFFFMKISI